MQENTWCQYFKQSLITVNSNVKTNCNEEGRHLIPQLNEKIPRILRNPNIHRCIYNSPPFPSSISRWIYSNMPLLRSILFILILFYHLILGFPSSPFPFSVWKQVLCDSKINSNWNLIFKHIRRPRCRNLSAVTCRTAGQAPFLVEGYTLVCYRTKLLRCRAVKESIYLILAGQIAKFRKEW